MPAVSIGTSATTVVAAGRQRQSVLIQNAHASQVLYVDTASDLTTSTGIKVAAGESVRLKTRKKVYGIASGASTDVRYLEEF